MSLRFLFPLLASLWALISNAQSVVLSPQSSSQPDGPVAVYQDLQDALRHPHRVRTLVLSGMDSLPPTVGRLKNLQVLRVENGNLRELPPSLGKLHQLRELHVAGNQLTHLPASLKKLNRLEVLDLGNNHFTQLPTLEKSFSRLRKLNLSANRLGSLPPGLDKLSALHELNLDRNPLKVLPSEIGDLAALHSFSAIGGQLTSLPESMGNLQSLQSLSLGENQLTQLPTSLGKLTSLKKLSLEGNRLAELPRELEGLKHLEALNITGNTLAHLPDGLEKLPRLENLHVGNNPLHDVPPGLRKYINLNDAPVAAGPLAPLRDELSQQVHALQLPTAVKAVNEQISHVGQHTDVAQPGAFDRSELAQLPSLPVMQVAPRGLSNLDSLRHEWLSAEKQRLLEKQVSELHKDVLLKEKQSLQARTFFEGVVGINNRAELLTLSPAAGIGIIRRISAGLGPVLHLNSKNIGKDVSFGLRSFARYELLKKKLNLQLEDIGDLSRFPASGLQETRGEMIVHTLYAGAGYLLNYSSLKSISINALYQLNRNRQSASPYSPFVFRVGFSAFNHKHK